MPTPNFRFKQFEVYHDRCAMKVGMDGVTLGAWAELPALEDASEARILDIGTGCGLIALMLAQKYPSAQIDAIEIDPEAAAQDYENVQASPWKHRVRVHQGSFPEIMNTGALGAAAGGYHLAVCNPPFFKGELRPADAGRNLARHVGALTFAALAQGAAASLHPQGRFSLIIPYSEAETFDNLAYQSGLYAIKACKLIPVEGALPKRILLTYSRTRSLLQREELVIKTKDNIYTADYQNLTKDYYLEK